MDLHELVNRMELCASLKECLSDKIPTLATKDFMLINNELYINAAPVALKVIGESKSTTSYIDELVQLQSVSASEPHPNAGAFLIRRKPRVEGTSLSPAKCRGFFVIGGNTAFKPVPIRTLDRGIVLKPHLAAFVIKEVQTLLNNNCSVQIKTIRPEHVEVACVNGLAYITLQISGVQRQQQQREDQYRGKDYYLCQLYERLVVTNTDSVCNLDATAPSFVESSEAILSSRICKPFNPIDDLRAINVEFEEDLHRLGTRVMDGLRIGSRVVSAKKVKSGSGAQASVTVYLLDNKYHVAFKYIPRTKIFEISKGDRIIKQRQAPIKTEQQLTQAKMTNIPSCRGLMQGVKIMSNQVVAMDPADSDLKELGTLRPVLAASVMAKVCDTLQCLKQKGLYYHDVKPANILLFAARNAVELADIGSLAENKLGPITLWSVSLANRDGDDVVVNRDMTLYNGDMATFYEKISVYTVLVTFILLITGDMSIFVTGESVNENLRAFLFNFQTLIDENRSQWVQEETKVCLNVMNFLRSVLVSPRKELEITQKLAAGKPKSIDPPELNLPSLAEILPHLSFAR